MPDLNFYQTKVGRDFYDRNIPKIADALGRIADALEVIAVTFRPDILKAIHRGKGSYALMWEKSKEFVNNRRYTRTQADEALKKIESGEWTLDDLKR